VLAPLANVGGLNLNWFKCLQSCRTVFALLDNSLAALFTSPPQTGPQPVSRGFRQADLPTVLAVSRRVPTTQYAVKWFKVPKASGTASRLVQNFSALSAILDLSAAKPDFPHIHTLMLSILSASAVALADFANWFYQIPIPENWSKYLQGKIACSRGHFICVALRVLSMGLGVSVFIAHTLAKAFAIHAAFAFSSVFKTAWVDNLIAAGSTEDVTAVSEAWTNAATAANIAWSEKPKVYTDECEILGLRFNLAHKHVTATEKTKEKLRRNLERLDGTLRDLLGVVGLLLWLNFVICRCPLAFAESLLSWLRVMASDLSRLDLPVHLPVSAREDIDRLTNLALSARLSLDDLTVPSTSALTLFSDAASAALGAVMRTADGFSVRSWPADPALHIFAKEMLAHIFSLQLVPRGIHAVGVGIDSTNVLSAIRRGHSSSYVVNQMLRSYFIYREQRNLHVSSAFVPSARNLADFPSRGRALPPNAIDFFDSAPPTVPLPFFAVPPWSAR